MYSNFKVVLKLKYWMDPIHLETKYYLCFMLLGFNIRSIKYNNNNCYIDNVDNPPDNLISVI